MPDLAEDRVVVRFVANMSDIEKKLKELKDTAKAVGKALSDAADGGKGGKGDKGSRGDLGPEKAWWAKLTKAQKEEMANRIKNHLWATKRARELDKVYVADAKKAFEDKKKAFLKALDDEDKADKTGKKKAKAAADKHWADLKKAMDKASKEYLADKIKMDKAHLAALKEDAARTEKAAKDAADRSFFGSKGAYVRGWKTWMDMVSKIRSVVYMVRVAFDAFRALYRIAQFIVNVFVTIIRVWANVVGTALKLGAAIGVAMVGALALATKQAIEFETAMLRVGGVLGQNLQQLGPLKRAILDVSAATTVAAKDIAAGAFQLASFGYGQRQTARMLPGVTALAMAASGETGGDVNYEKNAELVARMLLVWRQPAEEAMRVANLLAAANAKSAATFQRLHDAMTKAAQAAALVNMPMEEMVATVSQLMNAGMEGGQAGAAILGMIQRLLKPTKEWSDAIAPNLQRMGMTMRDVNPAVVGFRTALVNLQKLGLDPVQVATFRNRTGMLAMNILLRQGIREHDRLTAAITGTNQAQTQAALMVSGVKGRWDFFTSSIKRFAIILTDQLRPVIAWFLDKIGRWVNAFTNTPMVQAFADAIAGLAKDFAELAIWLLYTLDLKKRWPSFVEALVGYMRTAARVVTVAFGFIEWAFAEISNPGSNARKLWTSFWQFVVDSVIWAGQILVGAWTGLQYLMEHGFGSMTDAAKVWGNTFMGIVLEVCRTVVAEISRMVGTTLGNIGAWITATGGALIGLGMALKKPQIIAAGAKVAISGISTLATSRALKDEADRLEKMDIGQAIGRAGGRMEEIISRYSSSAATAAAKKKLDDARELYTEAKAAYEAGEGSPSAPELERYRQRYVAAQEEFGRASLATPGARIARAIVIGKAEAMEWGAGARRTLAGGIPAGPVTGAVSDTMTGGITEFLRRALDLRRRADLVGRGVDAEGNIGKFSNELADVEDGLDDNTESTDKLTDSNKTLASSMDGIVYKIIGAPMEAIRRYISPAGLMAGAGGGNLGALMGYPGGPAPQPEIVVRNIFEFRGPQLYSLVDQRVERGNRDLARQLVPALRGGGY